MKYLEKYPLLTLAFTILGFSYMIKGYEEQSKTFMIMGYILSLPFPALTLHVLSEVFCPDSTKPEHLDQNYE